MKNLRLASLFLAFCILPVTSHAEPELKGSPQDLRGFLYPADKVVTISGHAETRAYSDKAIISLVVTTENKLLSEAIAENTKLRNSIATVLTSAGIDRQAIRNSRFSSSPQYGWFGSKPSSYKVVNRIAITISQSTHLETIAAEADRHEEVEFTDTEFKHSAEDEFNRKVKAEALDKILKQKAFYEKSLGVKLSPIGIRDSHITQRATRGALALDQAVMSVRSKEAAGYSSVTQLREPAQGSSFDEILYEANLSVDFKIE